MSYKIRKILVTEEALTDIERIVNNSKEEGLVDVKAHFNVDESKMEFELHYKSIENEGEFFTRTISINTENT